MRPIIRLLLIFAALGPSQTRAESTNWKIIADQSSLTFSATQVGQAFTGKFNSFEADIRFDPADLANSYVLATIDMGSVDTDDSQRNAALPSPDWFASRRFPAAKFEAKAFTAIANGEYEARGTLTIKGIEKSVLLPFSLEIESDRARMQGELVIVRTDYGVGQGQWQSVQWVGAEVKVFVDISATRAAN